MGMAILIGALLVIFGGLAWYNIDVFSKAARQIRPDSPDCVQIKAKVTDRARPTGTRNSGATMNYTYEVAGKRFEKREDIDESAYLLTLKADSVAICYDRNQPEKSNVIASEHNSVSILQVIIIDAAMLVTFVLVILFARREGKAKT